MLQLTGGKAGVRVVSIAKAEDLVAGTNCDGYRHGTVEWKSIDAVLPFGISFLTSCFEKGWT